jgi:hypothetical protein
MPSIVIPITAEGAIIEVLIGVSHAKSIALAKLGQPVPSPIKARLLVDTGASATNIQVGLLNPLSLTPTGSTMVFTSTSGSTPVPQALFDVSISLGQNLFVPNCAVVECQQLGGSIQGLLGRDILATCIMHYNPLLGHAVLSF